MKNENDILIRNVILIKNAILIRNVIYQLKSSFLFNTQKSLDIRNVLKTLGGNFYSLNVLSRSSSVPLYATVPLIIRLNLHVSQKPVV